jgi:hypothetical protein
MDLDLGVGPQLCRHFDQTLDLPAYETSTTGWVATGCSPSHLQDGVHQGVSNSCLLFILSVNHHNMQRASALGFEVIINEVFVLQVVPAKAAGVVAAQVAADLTTTGAPASVIGQRMKLTWLR